MGYIIVAGVSCVGKTSYCRFIAPPGGHIDIGLIRKGKTLPKKKWMLHACLNCPTIGGKKYGKAFSFGDVIEVVTIIATRAEMIDRARKRIKRKGVKESGWSRLYGNMDAEGLVKVYEPWLAFVDERGVKSIILHGIGLDNYVEVSKELCLKILRS